MSHYIPKASKPKQWFDIDGPYLVNDDLHFRFSYSLKNEKDFSFNDMMADAKKRKDIKEKVAEQLVKKYKGFPKDVDLNLITLQDVYYSKLKEKTCFIKVIIFDFSNVIVIDTKPPITKDGKATQGGKNYLTTGDIDSNHLKANLFVVVDILKDLHKSAISRGQTYLDFSFQSTATELEKMANDIISSFDGKVYELILNEDYSFEQFFIDEKRVVLNGNSTIFYSKRLNKLFSNYNNIVNEYRAKTFDAQSIDNFINSYITPTPKIDLSVDREFSTTDKLLKLIIGDPNLLNDDYKPTKEDFSEEFKKEILADMQGQSENVNDPVLKEIFKNSVYVSNLDDLYALILNRVDLESVVGIAVKCLMKMIPVSELKKTICRKIVQTIDGGQLSAISGFLEVAGDEISYQISKEIKTLKVDEDSKALLSYMNSDLDREDKVCLAVFAVIPAAILLLSKLLDSSDVFEDRVKKDLVLVKKAIQKRMEYLFPDNLPIFDMLSSVRDAIAEAAKAFLVSTIMYTVNRVLATVERVCDSADSDFVNNNVLPYSRININALIDKASEAKNNKSFREKYPNLDEFLDTLSKELTMTQVCLLISGVYKQEVLDVVYSILERPEFQEISQVLNKETIMEFFRELGNSVDKNECTQTLEYYDRRRKAIIEICENTDELKKTLFDKLFGDSVNAQDILDQIAKENKINREDFENLVDALNPRQYIDNSCKDYHPTQEFLSKRYIQEMIKVISKGFEYELSGFKQMFLRNKDYSSQLKKQLEKPEPQDPQIYVANPLRLALKENSQVILSESKDSITLQVEKAAIQATSTDTFAIYDGKSTDEKHDNIFDDYKKLIDSNNDLSYSLTTIDQNTFLGKTQRQVLQNILSKSADNGLFLRQKFASLELISGRVDKKGTCYDPLLSVSDFSAQYAKFLKEIVCKVGPDSDKYTLLKTSYDIYIYVLLFRQVLKSFFVMSIFNWSRLFDKDSLLKKNIIENIQKEITSNGEVFVKNLYDTLRLFGDTNKSDEQLLNDEIVSLIQLAESKLITRYIQADIDSGGLIAGSDNDTYFQQFVSNGKKNFVHQIADKVLSGPGVKGLSPGLYVEYYYKPIYNTEIRQNLSEEEQNAYDIIVEYLSLCNINSSITDLGLSDVFLPGFIRVKGLFTGYTGPFLSVKDEFRVENYYNYPEKTYDSVITALEAYKFRGLLSKEDTTSLFVKKFDKNSISNFRNQLKELILSKNVKLPKDFVFDCEKYIEDFLKDSTKRLVKGLFCGARLVLVAYNDNPLLVRSVQQLNNKLDKVEGNLCRVCLSKYEFEKQIADNDWNNFFEGGLESAIQDSDYEIALNGLENEVQNGQLLKLLDLKNLQSLAILQHSTLLEKNYPDINTMFKTTLGLSHNNVITQTNVINQNWIQTNKVMDNPNVGGGYQEFAIFEVVAKAFVKSMANTFDPTWRVFPLTPMGIAAKIMDEETENSPNPVDKINNGEKPDNNLC